MFGVFCRRWGVPLIDGGTVRLPRLIGTSRAMDMILTGRAVGADEAYQMGLANRLVPVGDERSAAETLAAEIARYPATCIATTGCRCSISTGCRRRRRSRTSGTTASSRLAADARAGAARFAGGAGRGGSFADLG